MIRHHKLLNLVLHKQIISIKDNKETIISPLEQITKANKTLYVVPKADRDLLLTEALTYIFKITIQQQNSAKAPSSVTVTVSKKDGTQLYSTTINNLDNYLAIFNGIGFMASSCQAEFKIIKPEQLVFTAQDLKEFVGASQ